MRLFRRKLTAVPPAPGAAGAALPLYELDPYPPQPRRPARLRLVRLWIFRVVCGVLLLLGVLDIEVGSPGDGLILILIAAVGGLEEYSYRRYLRRRAARLEALGQWPPGRT